MRWLASIIAKVREWLFGSPTPAPITADDLSAIVETLNRAPRSGWYAWEAAQYRATRAPWFDPHRYDNSNIAYPPPTVADHQANYAANALECDHAVGQDLCDRATYWIYLRTLADPLLRAIHLAKVDPISWCIAEYQKAGCPLVMPPRGWSSGAPAKQEFHMSMGF